MSESNTIKLSNAHAHMHSAQSGFGLPGGACYGLIAQSNLHYNSSCTLLRYVVDTCGRWRAPYFLHVVRLATNFEESYKLTDLV